MSGSRFLVTGATGMIGSALTRRLVERGEDVVILRRTGSSTELLEDVIEGVESRFGDVTNHSSVSRALSGIDIVFHVAGHIGFGGHGSGRRLKAINVEGTATVVNAALAAGVDRLVHTSSMAAFGTPKSALEIIDEETEGYPESGTSRYAISKYLSELEVQRGIAEGLDAVIVNPALVFGEGRSGENTGRMLEAIVKRRLPGYPPGGTNVVDVLDVVEGHIAALYRGSCGQRYFLGSENKSWKAIITELARALGVPPPRRRIPPGLVLAGGYLMQTWSWVTGIEPRVSVETARLSLQKRTYSNRKATEELGVTFRPFAETAQRLAHLPY